MGRQSGLDINYGGVRDVQLSATLPYAAHADGTSRLALGDVEAGVKYRFVHQAGGVADISVFPKLSIPTGGSGSSGRLGAELPVWAQRDLGRWSLFGGGGYAINPGAGRRNYWFAGATLTRQVARRLTLGGELFRQGRDTSDGRAATVAGLGATWAAAKRWSLLAASDTSLGSGAAARGRRVYLAILFHD